MKLFHLFVSLFFAIITLPALAGETDNDALDIKNYVLHEQNVATAGQPTPAELKKLIANGTKHIVTLRADDELDWDEAALVKEAGGSYHSLPITGKTEISFENAQKLADILAKTNGEDVLVHCGSSNRVGALFALNAFTKSAQEGKPVSVEKAIEVGKQYGLTRLEPRVRELLSEK